jgi:hypothetical protein
MKLPSIDSREFKALPYKEKLRILSLAFFHKDEYTEQTGTGLSTPDSSILKNLPPPQPLAFYDLPAAFLRGYWTAYNCYYKEEWYAGEFGGLTPLDDFGIESKRVVNVRAFTFPLLTLDEPLYNIFLWLSRFDSATAWRASSLLRACKVYLYLDLVMRKLSPQGFPSDGTHVSSLVSEALDRFHREWHFLLLNCYCPIVEECNELGYFEDGVLLLLPQARKRKDRWFVPMVPSGLFTASKFHIKNWDFFR